MADSDLPERADYSAELEQVGIPHTARGVPVWDMNRLTHQLRYQAEKLGLVIHIDANKVARTVTFTTRRTTQ